MPASKVRVFGGISAIAIVGLIVAACGGGDPTATPRPTATQAPQPTATTAASQPRATTAASQPRATTAASQPRATTAAPPRATPTPAPTRTPAPTATAAPKSGGTLRLNAVAVRRLDPHYNPVQAGGRDFARFVFNGLVKWDAANSVPVPDLATLWEFDSNGDLIFKIRPGVKYHNEAPVNGRAMTAEDIKWSMDRMRNPDDPKAVYRNRFVNVEDIQVVDPSTIKFVMKGPDANLLLNLAHEWFVVLAREAAVDGGYDEPKSYIGTGPFTPELIQLTALSQFEKNPTYFREGRPYVDAITYIDGGDEATRSSLLKTGNLDWSYVQSPDNVEFFQGRTDARIEGTLGALRGFWGWGFNVTLAPFDDVRVRRAIHLGMNRQEEIALVYGGNAYLAGPLGANAPWHWSQEKLLSLPGMRPDKDADIAEAKRLLSQAGYDGGLEVTVFSRGAPGKDIQLFVEQLKAIGVTVKLETSTERIINTDRSVDVPSQWLSAGGGVTPDFALFQSYHSTAPRNFAHYTNPELEAMIDEQATTLDENKRIQQLDQIQQLLWDAMPYAPGTRPLGFWVAWDYVKNWTAPDHFCCEYRAAQIADVWLDQ